MKVLITGGAGYIGAALAQELADDSSIQEVIVFDNLSRANYNLFMGSRPLAKVRFVKGDLLDARTLAQALQNVDVVYHLAAIVSTPFADSQVHQFEQVNHWGTAELVRLLEESDVKRLIYVSSTSVYGATQEPVNEDSAPQPTSFYGISKYQGEEQVLRLINHGISVRIVRSGNVYGIGSSTRFDSVINKLMFEAHHIGRIKIFGDGNQQRSFVYLPRLVSQLKEWMFSEADSGISISVDFVKSINEVVDTIKEVYPSLEMIFVNQNTQMRSLVVVPNKDLAVSQFQEDIQAIRSAFNVGSSGL